MARKPRIDFPGAFSHVIVRSNQRATIFHDPDDYTAYLERLERYRRRDSVTLHAYVLMTNHVHLLLETGAHPLSRTMQTLQFTYSQYYNRRYNKTALRGSEGVRALHFPGLHPEAAAWLVRERQINAVGIDTASIDYGQSTHFEAHVALLSHNVPVFENLAGLRALPSMGFEVIALPMKITGGTGGPLRVIAVLPPTP
jgi:kynurenine formamidase